MRKRKGKRVKEGKKRKKEKKGKERTATPEPVQSNLSSHPPSSAKQLAERRSKKKTE